MPRNLIGVGVVAACLRGVRFGTSEAVQQSWSRPAVLIAAERARADDTLRTGLVDWSVVSVNPGTGHESRRFYTSQWAGEDFLRIDRGDQDGVILRNSDGTPAKQYTYDGVRMHLKRGEALWFHAERATSARVYPRSHPSAWAGIWDVRALGLDPWNSDSSFYEVLQKNHGGDVRWSTGKEDGLDVVSAKIGDTTFKWWIDTERGWNPVRTAVLDESGINADNRITLGRFGEIWYPQVVERYARNYEGGRSPYQTIRVTSASFNRDDFPQQLTPENIGVEVGTSIQYFDKRTPAIQFWDGSKSIPWEEFQTRLKAGELQYGPTMARELGIAQRRDGAPPAPDNAPARIHKTFESEWEQYTRQFIKRYRLDKAQTETGLAILRDCQDAGRHYLAKRRTQFEDLDRRIARATESGDARSADAIKKLRMRVRALSSPIDDIFKLRLKPRLDKLPTRAQRKGVEDAKP